MAESPRGRDHVLTALAVAMGLLAFSNATKPISQALGSPSAGFVFLGIRLHGVANAIVGPAFGAALAAYAYGVWTRRRWVVPLAIAYACWVPMNLVLFVLVNGVEGPGGALGIALYALVAIGVSAGGAWYLRTNRDSLLG